MELTDMEANLKAQLKSVDASKMVLAKDQADLSDMQLTFTIICQQQVVNLRDYRELRQGILELVDRVAKSHRQLNALAAVIKTLHSRLEEKQLGADNLLTELKNLGKVVTWTKQND